MNGSTDHVVQKIESSLPVCLSDRDSESPMLLGSLLELSQQITIDGTSKKEHDELQESNNKLQKPQVIYLRNVILYTCLKEVLFDSEVEGEMSRRQLSEQNDAICCMELLNSFVGSNNSLEDGVRLLDIQPCHMNCKLTAYTLKSVTSLIEDKMQSWIEDCKTCFTIDDTDLEKMVKSSLQSVEFLQSEVVRLSQKRQLKHRQYILLLRSVLSVVEKHINLYINEKQTYHKESAGILKTRFEALYQKSKVKKNQVSKEVYNVPTKSALELVNKHLVNRTDQAESELLTVQAKLTEYESLGPQFVQLANEYETVLKLISSKTQVLNLVEESDPG